jgi:hypothetical protein
MVKNLSPTTWIKLAISVVAAGAITVRVIWPNVKIDLIALGLILLGVLPWLSSILESAKFPGGWEITFRDVQKAASQVTAGADSEPTAAPKPSFMSFSAQDPNLALVGLRIEIEKRLRELAVEHGLPDLPSLRQILNELRRKEVLDQQALEGLDKLIDAGTRAAHGATVQAPVAQWAIEYAPKVLAVLDDHLESARG